MVGADTKTYLYLDPAKVLRRRALSSGTRQIGLGTVTHQNIGYLWPMGPFYWFFDAIGVPDWVAQRLWIGTVMFAAGMGVRYLLPHAGVGSATSAGPSEQWGAVLVAMLAYMFSPYLLELLGPHLGDPAAVGGAALAHRPHGQVLAPRRLALSRAVRPRGADRRAGSTPPR